MERSVKGKSRGGKVLHDPGFEATGNFYTAQHHELYALQQGALKPPSDHVPRIIRCGEDPEPTGTPATYLGMSPWLKMRLVLLWKAGY